MPITKKEVSKRVRIDFKGAKGALKEEIKRQVGEMLVEEINSHLDRSQSPVSKGRFKKQKKNKKASKLFESGDMRSQITFAEFRDGVDVGVFDDEQAIKLFNHNTGDTVPQREAIPSKDKNFRPSIREKIKEIVREINER